MVLVLKHLLLLAGGLDAFAYGNMHTTSLSYKRGDKLPLKGEFHPHSVTRSSSHTSSPPSVPSSSSFPSSSSLVATTCASSTTMIAMGGAAAAAVSRPLSRTGILAIINAFFKNYPYLSSFVSTGLKASLADFAAQTTEAERNKGFDFLRNLTFLLYGGLYQGCAQYYFYNIVFPKLFGVGTDPVSVARKVFADLLILTPFVCLPSVYFLKAIVFRYSFKEAAKRYWLDVKEQKVVIKYWMLWGPVQTLTFGFIPPHLRIIFIAGVSFFWLIILSRLSSKSDIR